MALFIVASVFVAVGGEREKWRDALATPRLYFSHPGKVGSARKSWSFTVEGVGAMATEFRDEIEWCGEVRRDDALVWSACVDASSLFESIDSKFCEYGAGQDCASGSMEVDARLPDGDYVQTMQLKRRGRPVSDSKSRRSYVGSIPQGDGSTRLAEMLASRSGEFCLDRAVAQMPGMAGRGLRELLCNLFRRQPASKYLEVGVYKGATLFAASSSNLGLRSIGVDNWSQFDHDDAKRFVVDRLETYAPNATLLDRDAFTSPLSSELLDLSPFDVYFYDAGHSPTDHYRALPHYLPVLNDTFLFLVDDWEMPHVAESTYAAVNHARLEVLWHREIVSPLPFASDTDDDPVSSFVANWNNGLGIFLLAKTLY